MESDLSLGVLHPIFGIARCPAASGLACGRALHQIVDVDNVELSGARLPFSSHCGLNGHEPWASPGASSKKLRALCQLPRSQARPQATPLSADFSVPASAGVSPSHQPAATRTSGRWFPCQMVSLPDGSCFKQTEPWMKCRSPLLDLNQADDRLRCWRWGQSHQAHRFRHAKKQSRFNPTYQRPHLPGYLRGHLLHPQNRFHSSVACILGAVASKG